MVGVPGRSKACITCRRRRKGCDFGRPTCAQCRKQGLQCGGYDNPRVFVVSTPETRQVGYSAPSSTSTSTSNSSQSHPPLESSRSWASTQPRRQKTHSNTNTITNLRLLSRPEDQRRCLNLFWEAYFPSGKPIPPDAIRSYTCTWTETARDAWEKDDSLRYALWANSLHICGKRNKEEWMVREGSKMYGKALADLRKSLSVSRGVFKNASIATVKLLSMFEAPFQQEQKHSESPDWQRHSAGELALFVARKPEAHKEGDSHHIFADERVEMALTSILQRTRLVLSDPEWKAIPWQGTTPKNLKDILVDVLVEMPGLVEEFDIMMRQLRHLELSYSASSPTKRTAATTEATTLRNKLVAKCWEYDRQLLDWSNLVFQLPAHPPPPQPTPTTGRTGDDKPQINQQSLVIKIAQIHGMALYWTTCLVLYSILQKASTSYLSSESHPSDIQEETTSSHSVKDPCGSILSQRFNPLAHANHLVDALSILLQPCAGLYGQRSAALPLEVALEYVGCMGTGTGSGTGNIASNSNGGDLVSGINTDSLHGVGPETQRNFADGDVPRASDVLEKLRRLKEKMDKGVHF